MRPSWNTVLLAALPLASALYENGSIIAPCDSPVYCYGDLLREIELARPFTDSKTFVDLPTIRPLNEVLAAFANLSRPITNDTALNNFLTTYFGQAGSEIEAVPIEDLTTQPDFLDSVNSSTVASFVSQVIDIWPDLTRRYTGGSTNCSDCVNSFLPLDRPFVVAGGRFREPYYWDSFFTMEGLLRTQGSFTNISLNIIENFLDFVEEFGFVPNGARRYYLNRSQPPLLTQMVKIYVEYTNNYTILERALPLLEKEYDFWSTNRTVTLTRAGRNYTLNHYAVENTQPRPESYYEDYQTANNASYYSKNGTIYNSTGELSDEEMAQLYANLASGAESGWDYSSRWLRTPQDAVSDTYFPLRSLNTVEILPVDLNSILYANEITIAGFYKHAGNYSAAAAWASLAAQRQDAMTAMLWDAEHYAYFDYNMTAGAKDIYIPSDNTTISADTNGAPAGQEVGFNPAQFYPFWTGAAPDELTNNPTNLRRAYSRISDLLDNREGAIAATNLGTGQQWDEPNVWPPLQYIIIQGLLAAPLDTFSLPSDSGNQTVEDYVWTQDLALRLAQRYLDSTFCTWRVTGGSTPDTPKLQGATGNGIMFEKYSDEATNARGGGGEYTVVEGFGWTNGVLIWAADVFGAQLQTPDCGDITAAQPAPPRRRKRDQSAVELSERDAKWVKRFT